MSIPKIPRDRQLSVWPRGSRHRKGSCPSNLPHWFLYRNTRPGICSPCRMGSGNPLLLLKLSMTRRDKPFMVNGHGFVLNKLEPLEISKFQGSLNLRHNTSKYHSRKRCHYNHYQNVYDSSFGTHNIPDHQHVG